MSKNTCLSFPSSNNAPIPNSQPPKIILMNQNRPVTCPVWLLLFYFFQDLPDGFGQLNGQVSALHFYCKSCLPWWFPDASMLQALPYITAILQAHHPDSIHGIVNTVIHKLVAAAKSRAVLDPKHDTEILNGMLQHNAA